MTHSATARDVLTYCVDSNDVLVAVGGGWDGFAVDNDGAELVEKNILGRSLWDFVSDETTREVYRHLILRVRAGETLVFPFRCDGPETIRRLQMSLTPLQNGRLQFATRPLALEVRPSVRLLDRRTARSGDPLRTCAWCSRVKVGAEWLSVEQAVVKLQLFETARLPPLTHGICADCLTDELSVQAASHLPAGRQPQPVDPDLTHDR